MKINVNYIDNSITVEDDSVMCIEIENKSYFYRLVNDFNIISNGDVPESISFFDWNNEELDLTSKIGLYIDYFNIDLNSKRNINSLYKIIKSNLVEENKNKLMILYSKMKSILSKLLVDYDIPLLIDDDFDLENILKLVKIKIKTSNDLLSNLLLLIDINKIFKNNELLIFVNLKQYLKESELNEFYKYSLYNNEKVLLIDSQSYGVTTKYEKKIIIDSNLDEFLL